MKRRYRVLRIRPLILAVMGVALCVSVGVLGGLAKSAGAWSAQERRPIYSVETDSPNVSIGINCAWGNEDIPALLEILDNHGIKASFFIVGDWCDRFPESVRLISDAGHDVGSHSDTHADMTKLDESGIVREIRDSAAKLEKITGKPVELFRVPSGAYNSRVIELIERDGMYPIQWDCEGMDMKTGNNLQA